MYCLLHGPVIKVHVNNQKCAALFIDGMKSGQVVMYNDYTEDEYFMVAESHGHGNTNTSDKKFCYAFLTK